MYENDYTARDILASGGEDIISKDLHSNYMYERWSARENSFRSVRELGASVLVNKLSRSGRLLRSRVPVAALASDYSPSGNSGGRRKSYLSMNLNLLKFSAINYGAYLL